MRDLPASRILVPVDLSPVSAHAWRWAEVFAAPGAHMEALYVHEIPPTPVMGLPSPSLSAAMRARILARLKRFRPGAAVRVEQGDPASAVVRRARGFDLIVMGSHGRRGLDRALLGSVCESVVRDAGVPVLAVKAGPRRVTSVLAPVNLMPYSRKGFELAARAAAAFGATLAVLHVSRDAQHDSNPRLLLGGLLARLPEELRKAVRPRLIRRDGDPVREILKESRRHGLVVLTAHRKSLFSDLVLGTIAERVLRHCPRPVLAAPSGR
ncbi:MAG: hypothetical protein A2X40_06755 [Elusimicrobia bacterium GWC2_65_9]|nr:MAG: hypothetical protein A2X37_06770 [Elusimicrobia bacterium GWA2_66_18]OGR73486.1 MAG: hypothetical protein A2X40_06755 [Elusimicrobia bacterium GWC2_65_9]